MITVTHNGDDITSEVGTDDFEISSERNSTRDTFRFRVEKQPGGFTPELNAEIIVTKDSVTIFGGSIVSMETSIEEIPTVIYEVECLDFTQQADRRLIEERFIDTSINDIIATLVTDYAPGYTTVNVMAPQVVSRISFNRLTFSECLDKLAKLSNFSWYIDYDKDVHFFAKAQELAPFNLSDTSANYVFESLRIRSDLSQLRNIVQVQGGDYPSAERTTLHAGDGERTEFPTNFKFATVPVVKVNGLIKTVGVENLDVTGFDCYWSFQEKYVRFDPASIPAAPGGGDTTNIELIGNPLVPLVAIIPDNDSIAEFGEFEHSITDKTLRTQDDAIGRGIAELEAYAAELTEASFDTTTPGLMSGQLMTIDSALHGVTADYVIQSVNFRPYPNGASLDGVWSVSLASSASLTLVEALRSLLKQEELEADEMEVLLAFYTFADRGIGSDEADDAEYTVAPYLLADENGDVLPGYAPFICNFCKLEP